MKIKAVVLDLDQTLSMDTPSWLEFTELLGADPKVHQEIFEKFKAGELDYKTAKQQLFALWRSKSRLERKEIVKLFGYVALRPGAYEAVEYLKSKYRVCIISGAIDVFVDIVGNSLGVKDIHATTKFIFDTDDRLVDFKYNLNRAEEKLPEFQKFCSLHKLDPQECAAIGDGDSDQPIFDIVGFPLLFLAKETSKELKEKYSHHIRNWRDIREVL